jgi:hypothetical protein
VKCGFDLLKKRFNILVISGRSYSQHILNLIMHACIILHNMIIDDERDNGYDDNYHTITSVVASSVTYGALTSLIIILQSEPHLIDVFESSIRLDQACVEQVPLI